MKDFATIILSIIGMLISLVFLLMGLCSFAVSGPISTNGGYILLGILFIAISVCIVMIVMKLNGQGSD